MSTNTNTIINQTHNAHPYIVNGGNTSTAEYAVVVDSGTSPSFVTTLTENGSGGLFTFDGVYDAATLTYTINNVRFTDGANVAANITNQITYELVLGVTITDSTNTDTDTNTIATLSSTITIYVSSSTTIFEKVLPSQPGTIRVTLNEGEANTTSESFPFSQHTNVSERVQFVATIYESLNNPSPFILNTDSTTTTNTITIERVKKFYSTPDRSYESVAIHTTYTLTDTNGTLPGNEDVSNVVIYSSYSHSIRVEYNGADIIVVTTENGENAVSSDYYNGNAPNDCLPALRHGDGQTYLQSEQQVIPVFLNGYASWSLSDNTRFTMYINPDNTDPESEYTLGMQAKNMWIRCIPSGSVRIDDSNEEGIVRYADGAHYPVFITLTSDGKSLVQSISVVVTENVVTMTKYTTPNDCMSDDTCIIEVNAEADVNPTTFLMQDTHSFGTGDDGTMEDNLTFKIVDPINPTYGANDNTRIVSDVSFLLTTVYDSSTGRVTGTLQFGTSGTSVTSPVFNNNLQGNVYELYVYAQNTTNNHISSLKKIVISVRNNTNFFITGPKGTSDSIISNWMVANRGITKQPVIKIHALSNIPADSWTNISPPDTDSTDTTVSSYGDIKLEVWLGAVSGVAGAGDYVNMSYLLSPTLTISDKLNVLPAVNSTRKEIQFELNVAAILEDANASGTSHTKASVKITFPPSNTISDSIDYQNVEGTVNAEDNIGGYIVDKDNTPVYDIYNNYTKPTTSRETVFVFDYYTNTAFNAITKFDLTRTNDVGTAHVRDIYDPADPATYLSWPRGYPYSEIYVGLGSGGTPTIWDRPAKNIVYPSNAANFYYGLTYLARCVNQPTTSGPAGITLIEYYNGVDPTAPNGSIGYFTWTIKCRDGAIISYTRTVVISETTDELYGLAERKPPKLTQNTSQVVVFDATGDSAAPIYIKTYAEMADTDYSDTTTNMENVQLDIVNTSTPSTSDLATLWMYSVNPDDSITRKNAEYQSTYSITNEDVYSFKYDNNYGRFLDMGAPATIGVHYLAVETMMTSPEFPTVSSIVVAANWTKAQSDMPFIPEYSVMSKDGRPVNLGAFRDDWDETNGGIITYIMSESTTDSFGVELSGLRVDKDIHSPFILSTTSGDIDLDDTVFEKHAAISIDMRKHDFDNIFYYSPVDGSPMLGEDTIVTKQMLQEVDMTSVNNWTRWPELITTSTVPEQKLFELDVVLPPSSGSGTYVDKFEDNIVTTYRTLKASNIIVENWAYDIFNIPFMSDAFSTVPAMKDEIDSYLGSGDGSGFKFHDAIKAALEKASIISTKDPATGFDTIFNVKANIAKHLLYVLQHAVTDNSGIGKDNAYRLSTYSNGIFNDANRVTTGTYAGYYPFIFHAGDTMTIGVNFQHADMLGGEAYGSTSPDRILGDMPFKVKITMTN